MNLNGTTWKFNSTITLPSCYPSCDQLLIGVEDPGSDANVISVNNTPCIYMLITFRDNALESIGAYPDNESVLFMYFTGDGWTYDTFTFADDIETIGAFEPDRETFEAWLLENATQQQQISLTGTTWVFNDSISLDDIADRRINVTFTCQEDGDPHNFYGFYASGLNPSVLELSYLLSQNSGETVYYASMNHWTDDYLKTVTFTGEPSSEDAAVLVAWLQANAKLNLPSYIVGGNNLRDVADAIREKINSQSQLVFPAGFVTGINSIETKAPSATGVSF